MITRFQRSWQLFKASVAVTFSHRKLLLFPFITTCLTLVIALVFFSAVAGPAVLWSTRHPAGGNRPSVSLEQSDTTPKADAAAQASHKHGNRFSSEFGESIKSTAGRIVLLAIYLVSMFLATFFNVAMYGEILAALDGRGVSFRRGFRLAWSRLPSIFMWSLLAGAVGWLIRLVEERLPMGGRIVASLVGLAWSLAAVFAIPVIIQEENLRNPVKVLQHSATTLKRTWGESLIGYVGLSAGSLVLFLCSLLPLALFGGVAYLAKSGPIFAVGIVIWVFALLALSYVTRVAGHVYRCALYKYAVEGAVPEPFNQELMDMAWKVKKNF